MSAAGVTTTDRTIDGGPAGEGGYRPLRFGPGEPHVGSAPAGTEALLTIAHLSDLHVCDAQSPARLQFLDRWADPDSPLRPQVENVGTYRPQEILTTQVLDATVRALNRVAVGPVGRAPVDLAVVTGDNTDNAQLNELNWYLRLLDGGVVDPDSGDPTRFEGAGGTDTDDWFWHPEPGTDDRPKRLFGFPTVPTLLAAARQSFTASGLLVPWLAVHGNHDQMLQGTWPNRGPLAGWSTGDRHPISVRPDRSDAQVLALLDGLERCDPTAIAELVGVPAETVTADPARALMATTGFIAAHLQAGARPSGHGYATTDLAAGRAYYRHDRGGVTVLALDTVNPHGGWEGSLDVVQFEWLDEQLEQADDDERHVILLSHHPLRSLINDHRGGAGPRRLGADVAALLDRHPSVVLWLNGHTHRTAITDHRGWWEITTPSLIDWPQQARIVELLRCSDGRLAVATTMVDHLGDTPWVGGTATVDALAGLSRELAANAWQERYPDLLDNPRTGTRADRNVVLVRPDPFREDQRTRVSALRRG